MDNNLLRYDVNEEGLVCQGRISKYKGEKLSKNLSFFMRPLTLKDCSQMEDLSVCIYDNLKEGQECFIHRHDRKYYREIMGETNSDTQFVGVFIGHQLIAMSNFKMVQNYTALQEEFPNHNLNIFSKERKLGQVKVAVLGSDSVHPKFRGNNLNKIMVQYRKALAEHLGATDTVSIIDRSNIWNMRPYFENGFNMFGASIDPADNGKIALLHRPMKENIQIQKGDEETAHFQNFNQIDKMFYMKRIGIGYDDENQRIIFAKTNYYDNMKNLENDNSKILMMRNMRNVASL